MKVVFPSAKIFGTSISAISALIEEGEFFFDEDGIRLRAMDPGKIAMVDFFYPKSAFDEYEANGEKLGFNLANLGSVVRRGKPTDKLVLRDEDGRLVLVFKGETTRRFTIPILDLGGVMPNEPNIPFDAEIKINAGFLKDSFKDASIVSSHIVLKATPEAFYMEAVGDKGEVKIVVEKDEDVIEDLKVHGEARAMFPLGYLSDIVAAADPSSITTIKLKTDSPLNVKYKIGEGFVSYYIAPRIESI